MEDESVRKEHSRGHVITCHVIHTLWTGGVGASVMLMAGDVVKEVKLEKPRAVGMTGKLSVCISVWVS